jgi:hypothetical protein
MEAEKERFEKPVVTKFGNSNHFNPLPLSHRVELAQHVEVPLLLKEIVALAFVSVMVFKELAPIPPSAMASSGELGKVQVTRVVCPNDFPEISTVIRRHNSDKKTNKVFGFFSKILKDLLAITFRILFLIKF